jgi:hypothetical protein
MEGGQGSMKLLRVRADELRHGDIAHFPSTWTREVDSVRAVAGRRFVNVTLSDGAVLTVRTSSGWMIEVDD